MKPKATLLAGVSTLVLLAACAQQEEPAVVQVEPIYDKYGNVVYVPAADGTVVPVSGGDGGSSTVPGDDTNGSDDDGSDDDGTGQNRNQYQSQTTSENQNTNENQNSNENQNRNQSGG
ncbi:hypothetical protein ACRDNQ_10500 [Palleronia sp. KMU-117]|uniref:hypothetical protein n=1 Tax=Palleronia sp. KMU-117 TaxID=3434108 RepID=UPI003D71E05C